MEETQKRMHATIHGIVQGVGFRFFVFQYGVNLGLQGWVRNRFNGEVEVVAEGSQSILNEFLEKLKEGPQMAQVEEVQVEWSGPSGDLQPFTILETA
jgi:Acylphosphatases